MKTLLKVSIFVCIIGLLILVLYNNYPVKAGDNFENKNETNFSVYLGKWFSSTKAKDFESVLYEGGAILEINEVKNNYIRGYYGEIQSPPANRIAYFEFGDFVTNNKIAFDFVDSFFNKGKATIKFRKGITVIINNVETSRDNLSNWQVHRGKFKFTKEK